MIQGMVLDGSCVMIHLSSEQTILQHQKHYRNYVIEEASESSKHIGAANLVGMIKRDPPEAVVRQLQLVRFGRLLC